jgi:molecular chaperone DnaJ
MNYNENYYQELGLDKNANEEEIKKAYRKLALKYHPDRNQGNKDFESKFQKINEANSILSDPQTKQEYDTRSPHGKSYSPFNPFGGSGFEFSFDNNDFFSKIFGGFNPFDGFNPFQREEFRENLDVNSSITINLKQIYTDEKLVLKYMRYIHCDDCKGSGFDKNSHADKCDICNGTGKDNGKTCTYCRGEGKVYLGQCKTCGGEKVVLKETEVNIHNVAHFRGSIRNSYLGYGHQSKYYKNKIGKLILNINIDRNDEYKIINDYELHRTIDVHFQDAIDGTEIQYVHIDDSILKIKLPTKTKNGDIIRVKEKGLLKNSKRDDLYLKINIIIDYDRI